MDTDALFAPQNIEDVRNLALRLLTELELRRETENTQLIKENQALLRYIQALEAALKAARAWRFARKSEAFHGEQRQRVEEDVDADTADLERQLTALLPAAAPVPAARPKRQPLPPELPRRDVRHDLDSQACPDCGGALRFIRDEVSEELEYIPARFLVHRHIRPQYGCGCCDTVHSASLPARLIDKGQPGPGLAKCCDHLPLYRQQKIYQRSGVNLPRSTLTDWFGVVGAALKPLAAALHRDLLQQPVLQADETPLLLLIPGKGKTQKGYIWTYVSAAGSDKAVVLYDCRPGRAGAYAQAILQGWQGTLVVDGYVGYAPLFKEGAVLEAGCWAHVRRYFFDQYKANGSPLAEVALKTIRELYKLERLIKQRPAGQRRRWRKRYAKPRLKDFHDWLQLKEQNTAAGSGIHKAIRYALSRWSALLVYLEDGRVPIDNNRTESAIRPVAVGRKNWLFAGSLPAGQRMAAILSLLETAKMNGLEPFIWACPENCVNAYIPITC